MTRQRRRPPARARAWEPLQQTSLPPEAADHLRELGMPQPQEVWGSSVYSVMVRYGDVEPGYVASRDGMLWLSIHRRDRKPLRDWRHFQAIKNEVAGAERVAVEVYPPESQLVDTSNEYHLWVLPVGAVVPFSPGDGTRLVLTPDELADEDPTGKAVQRPWQDDLPTGATLDVPATRGEPA